jgi:hypothetical protein
MARAWQGLQAGRGGARASAHLVEGLVLVGIEAGRVVKVVRARSGERRHLCALCCGRARPSGAEASCGCGCLARRARPRAREGARATAQRGATPGLAELGRAGAAHAALGATATATTTRGGRSAEPSRRRCVGAMLWCSTRRSVLARRVCKRVRSAAVLHMRGHLPASPPGRPAGQPAFDGLGQAPPCTAACRKPAARRGFAPRPAAPQLLEQQAPAAAVAAPAPAAPLVLAC